MSSDLNYEGLAPNEESLIELKITKALEEAKAEASRIANDAINNALKAKELQNAPVFGDEVKDATQVNYRPALQMEREHIVKKSELPTIKRNIPPLLSDEEKMFFLSQDKSFEPYNPILFKDNEVFKITFYQGYVIERLVKESTQQVLYHSPSNMAEEFSVLGGDCFYVEFSTDEKGNIVNDPIIVKKPDGSSEDRFYPEVGEYDGQTGKFLYKLCSVESNDGELTVKRFHAGDNIHHVIERATMLNLPVVPPESTPLENVWNVLKDYLPENDEVRYRSLKQLDVLGEPLINPLQTGETKETKETIDFRRIAERETGLAQIKVKGREAGIIHIEGNNKSGRLVKTTTTPSESGSGTPTVTEQVLLEWDDGLVTTEGDVFFEGGTGGAGCVDAGTGTLETIEEGASTGTPLLTWENGCVKTNGTIQLEVVELEVCIDGVPTLKKFLTLPEPPPPAP